jgi:hypothetical protein
VAVDFFHRRRPLFLDERIKWLPKAIPDSEIRDADLSLDDARPAIARYYDFLDWPSLTAHVEGVCWKGAVFEFERAVEAVVNGKLATLEDVLSRNPALVGARSSRVCCFDPQYTVPRSCTISPLTASKHTPEDAAQCCGGRPRAAPVRCRT